MDLDSPVQGKTNSDSQGGLHDVIVTHSDTHMQGARTGTSSSIQRHGEIIEKMELAFRFTSLEIDTEEKYSMLSASSFISPLNRVRMSVQRS